MTPKVYGVQPPTATPTPPDHRYERIMSTVQQLNSCDTACCLDFILLTNRADSALLTELDGWLKQLPPERRTRSAPFSLEELRALDMTAEQIKKEGRAK